MARAFERAYTCGNRRIRIRAAGGEHSCGKRGVVTAAVIRVKHKDNIKQLVLDERQRELMFEGKRWYDLVRMVRHSESPTQTMSVLRNTYLMRKYQKNGQDAVTRLGSVNNLYLPFHQNEIDVNPLLAADQNPAYVY